jgi:hypothetical protein
MAAVLAFSVAGCGLLGSKSSGSSSSSPNAAAGSSSSPGAAPGGGSGQTAGQAGASLHAGNYTLTTTSGFSGFTAGTATTGGTDGASPMEKLASCLGTTASAEAATDQAESAHLVNKTTGVTIWSDAQIVPAGRLSQDTNLLRDPNFTTCVTNQTKKDGITYLQNSGQGSLLDPEADTRDAPLPNGALARTSIVVLAGLSGGGQAQLFYDTIYVGSGQVEAQLHLFGTIDPPSEDLVSVAVAQLLAKLGQ